MIARGETLDLFGPRRRLSLADLLDDEDNPDPDGLRWFQRDGYDAFMAGVARKTRAQLAVLATGLGKTQLFCCIAKHWTQGDVLILAHRDELVTQARDRLEQMTGALVEIEQGDYRASSRAHWVVGSTDSVKRKDRLERLGRERFGLVIVDEAHHYAAGTYQRPLEWFHNASILGVTATPDRADEVALGKVFDEVCYCMDIEDGIDHGYLVPLRGTHVNVQEIELDKVGTKANGEFIESELDEVMVKAVEGIVHETIRLEPDRQGIAFFPGRRSAELAMHKFNAARPGSAVYIDGETERDTRRRIVKDFRARRYQYLCNCAVATEGFDAPSANLIIQGRPTKSRARSAQEIGRGTRPLAGTVDHIHGKTDSATRRAAIARSAKPDCVILDFVGNNDKHSLVTIEDVLGGNYTDEEVALAKKKRTTAQGEDTQKLLKDARRELEMLAKAAKAKSVKSTVRKFDMFAVLGVQMTEERRFASYGQVPLTEGQAGALRAWGMSDKDIGDMTKRAASRLLDELIARKKAGLASYAQLKQLQRFGITERDVTFERAKAAMNYLTSKGWGSKGKIDPVELHAIITHQPRQAGED